MAINKNFVVKNGLEVSNDLILADAIRNKVGIGSTTPRTEFDVRGGIAATDISISGVGTIVTLQNITGIITTGYITNLTATNLLSGLSTITSLNATYVNSSGVVTATTLNVTGTGTLAVGVVTFLSGTNLNYSGIATVGGFVDINNSVDILNDVNIGGMTTIGGFVDINNSVDILNDLNIRGDLTFENANGDIYLKDNGVINFGDGNDLQIFHNSSVSVIRDGGTGGLLIDSDNEIKLAKNGTGSDTLAIFTPDGSVELYYDNAKKFETSGIGATVTGTLFTNELNSSGVATASALYIDGTSIVNNSRQLQNIASLDATTTATIETAIANAPNTFTDIRVSGVSTFVGLATFGAGIQIDGGIQVISGIATLGITTVTDITAQNLSVSGITTIENIRINSGIISATDITATDITSQNLNVSGISTIGNVKIFSGIITAVSGIVTYYGDASGLINVPAGVPGGSDTQIQYNSGGTTFAGSPNLTFNGNDLKIAGVCTAQDFDALSDINYKDNISTVNNALSKVEQLRGVQFNWKESGLSSYGVIAQELQEILPELVHGNNPRTVNYNGIIGVLIEAIKELSQKVSELENKNFNK